MKILLILLFALVTSIPSSAQKLTVESFVPTTDAIARTRNVKGTDGNVCAAVVVRIPSKEATFNGGFILNKPTYKDGEYILDMQTGAAQMRVSVPGLNTIDVKFRDYIGSTLQSKTTYLLTINMPQMGMPVQQDNGLTYFILNVQPKNAQVTIDGEPQPLDTNGEYSVLLPRTSHTYTVSAGGYDSKSETFVLGSERKNVDVSLESNMANLSISSYLSGVSIYINEQMKGTSSWSGQLKPGNYNVEARLDGYYPHKETITLSPRQNKTLAIPALIARVGSLDVSYKPNNSEVWIDGRKAGLSPDIFKNLQIGNHKVSIRKDGYKAEEQTVTITEGQTSTLTGTLEQGTSNASSSSTVGGAQTFTVKGVSFTMMPVEGGTFTMGATSEMKDPFDWENPTHPVTLSSYYIGETEVTQALWQAVMGYNPSIFKGDQNPVEKVSWNDCQTFISKLNELTGKRFRLPTEAEWEFAARGGTKSQHTQYSGSSNIDKVAWYTSNSGRKTHPVKTKKSNELGIYDMSGNVWEWCQDWFGTYSSGSQTNPTGPSSGSSRVCRGGSWLDYAWFCRSSYRYNITPGNRNYNLGLRLALSE